MFTVKKKKSYRNFLYASIIVVLCLLVVVIAWPAPSSVDNSAFESKDQDIRASVQSQDPLADLSEKENEPDDYISTDDEINGDEEIDDIAGQESSYYLVKKADGAVKVFFIDISGNMVELETTQILYELLGPEDQKLFDEGITVTSQEELTVLLQDFES